MLKKAGITVALLAGILLGNVQGCEFGAFHCTDVDNVGGPICFCNADGGFCGNDWTNGRSCMECPLD